MVMIQARPLLAFLLLCALSAALAQQPAEPQVGEGLPRAEGFTRVQAGAQGPRPKLPPRAFDAQLTFDARAFLEARRGAGLDEASGRLELQLACRAAARRAGERQLVELEPDGGDPAIQITTRLPLELGEWLERPTPAKLLFDSRPGPLGIDRVLSLDREDGRRMVYVQRHGSEPIRVELAAEPLELGERGWSLRQAPLEEAMRAPSRGWHHALPLVIERGDERTRLWQGQSTLLEVQPDGPRISVLVLVSEVARPGPEAAGLAEGDPFQLELLFFLAR
jgi:hypothetical protein